MVIADGLAPDWHQDICINHDDLDQLVFIRTVSVQIILIPYWYTATMLKYNSHAKVAFFILHTKRVIKTNKATREY